MGKCAVCVLANISNQRATKEITLKMRLKIFFWRPRLSVRKDQNNSVS